MPKTTAARAAVLSGLLVAAPPAAPGVDAFPVAAGSGETPAGLTHVSVVDPRGRAIADASVRFWVKDRGGLRVAAACRTDREGRCAASVGQEESVRLRWVEVEKAGFARLRRSGVALGASVSLTLQRPAVIEGRVVDEEGRPSGARIMPVDVTALGGDPRIPSVVEPVEVGRDGRFRIEDLPPGTYALILAGRGPGHEATLLEPAPRVTVGPGDPEGPVEVRILRHGRLSGRIAFFPRLPANVLVTPVPGEADPRAAGALGPFDMGYVASMRRPCRPVTEVECEFELVDLVPGLYRVEVEADGHGPYLAPQEDAVWPGRVTRTADLVVPPPVRLEGKVKVKGGGTVVPEAVAAIYFPGVPLAALDGRTDGQGRFGPLLLSPGEYRITVVHDDFVGYRGVFTVAQNVEAQALEIELDAGSVLAGAFVGRSRVTRAGVEVLVESLEDQTLKVRRTDGRGGFLFRGLKPGRYVVIADDGPDVALKKVEVAKDSSTVITLDSAVDVPVRGHGEDEGETPEEEAAPTLSGPG